MILAGALLLPSTWAALAWASPAGPLALAILLRAGSFIAPPPHPNCLFTLDNPAHGGCRPVEIPDGDFMMPGLLLTPVSSLSTERERREMGPRGAVCIIPGAGDTKVSFKWRLVKALLAEGLVVLTIDPPGHGDYRHRPMDFPDCLSAVPAAVRFLRQQPGVGRVGLLGISLGGALAMASLAQCAAEKAPERGLDACGVEALAVLETPVGLKYNRALVYREFWQTISRAPVLSMLGEISLKQIRESWYTGGYRSRHSGTAELIDLLDPPASLARIGDMPVLLVYSRSDPIASPAAARALQQAAPWAHLIHTKKASHVTLTLLPYINRQVARWLKDQLEPA